VTAALFGEGPGGFVVSGPSAALGELGEHATVRRLGRVGGDALTIGGDDQLSLAISLQELARAHASLEELFS
jgi:phosphoribosylformylglycinamidine synthase